MKISTIEYNKRFINQQRWYWNNNKFVKLHPFSAYQSIDELTLENSNSFTPNDCTKLWEVFEEVFEDIIDDIDEYLSDQYFSDVKYLVS